MKKIYSLPGLILGVIFLIAAFVLISKSVEESEQFKVEKDEIIKVLNFNDRLLSFRDWVFSETAWEEKKVKFEAAVTKGEEHYQNALKFGYFLLFVCTIFFVAMMVIYARKRLFYGLTMALSFIGLALLVQGVMNPILEMSAYKKDMTIKVYVHPNDIPYFEEIVDYMGEVSDIADYIKYVPVYGEEWAKGAKELVAEGQGYLKENADENVGFDKVFPGYTYFYYQNKGIMDVISLLWKADNKPVAIAIGTFSVIIPTVKLLFTLFILIFPVRGLKRLRKVLSYIAKWSMADVFVVGAFLAFLSFSNMSPGVEMDSKVLFGLYYFGAYVVISILLGFLLDASIKEKLKNDETGTVEIVPPTSDENILEEKSDEP
jgi:hypothetical protein